MLNTLKGTFDVDLQNKDAIMVLKDMEFETGVCEAVQGAMALHGYGQVVHELTLLQLFCRANKAC